MKNKAHYFDIKKDITVEEIADILQNAWPGGIINSQFSQLKRKTKRHFVTKNRSAYCDKCGSVLLINDTCIKERCENHVDHIPEPARGVAAFWDACCRYRQKRSEL